MYQFFLLKGNFTNLHACFNFCPVFIVQTRLRACWNKYRHHHNNGARSPYSWVLVGRGCGSLICQNTLKWRRSVANVWCSLHPIENYFFNTNTLIVHVHCCEVINVPCNYGGCGYVKILRTQLYIWLKGWLHVSESTLKISNSLFSNQLHVLRCMSKLFL